MRQRHNAEGGCRGSLSLSFLSVREVLKRLCSEGVVVLNSDKSYSLHPQAEAVLTGKIEA